MIGHLPSSERDKRMLRGRLVFLCASLATLLNIGDSWTKAPDVMRNYSSEQGGFLLRIPVNWNVLVPKEKALMPGTIKLSVLFSPERLEGRESKVKYALVVLRERFERLGIGFRSRTSEGRAAEFAQMLAVHESNAGRLQVVPLGKADRGMELWDFEITADLDGSECKFIRLLVSITDHEWFHAAWATPCRSMRKREKEISAMAESLNVLKDWQGSDGTNR